MGWGLRMGDFDFVEGAVFVGGGIMWIVGSVFTGAIEGYG